MSEQQQGRTEAFAWEAHMVQFHGPEETAALIAQARAKRAELEREEREAEAAARPADVVTHRKVRVSSVLVGLGRQAEIPGPQAARGRGGKNTRVEELGVKGGSFRGGKTLPGTAAKKAAADRPAKQPAGKAQHKG